MSDPFQTAIDALHRLGCKPKQQGESWTACCPIHEADGGSHTPSLTLKRGDKQPVIVKCHAGCDGRDILKALGIDSAAPRTQSKREIKATYSYRSADGTEVRQKIRYEPKDFRIRHQGADGQWVYKAGDGPAVLYRLPELREAIKAGQTIVIVEGEKDADRLAELGWAATTSIEGAARPDQKAKWRREYTEQLSGAKRVILLPDNDEPGKAHMQHIAAQLVGKVAELITLELPELPPKGDVSDWLDAGNSPDDLRLMIETAGAPIEVAPNDPDPRVVIHQAAKSSKAAASFRNAVRILQASEFGHGIAFNLFVGRLQRTAPMPWDETPGDWTDKDTGELMLHCADCHDVDFTADTVERAVALVAHRNAFNPAQDRLRALAEQWDGTPRLTTWLADYLSIEANPSSRAYLAEIGSAWMKGVAARVLKPGCKRDDVLTLVGPQGFGKSTASAAIADAICPNSFTDSIRNLGSEEAANEIRGITIAEFSELAAIARSELEAVKAFVSRSSDRFREKYQRHSTDHPRTCSFIASTNDDCGFLRDPSGNRRWWPVTVARPIDSAALKAALPALLGEAASRVLAGEPWHVTDAAALREAEAIREDHSDRDVWESAIMDAITLLAPSDRTIAEILRKIGVETSRQDRQATNRVSAVLRENGWKRKRGRLSSGDLGYLWACSPQSDVGEQEGNSSSARQQAGCSYVPICSPSEKDNCSGSSEDAGDHADTTPENVPGNFIGNLREQGEQGEQPRPGANPVREQQALDVLRRLYERQRQNLADGGISGIPRVRVADWARRLPGDGRATISALVAAGRVSVDGLFVAEVAP